MNREIVTTQSIKTILKIQDNKIAAISKSNTLATGVRLYNNNCMGIGGAYGKVDLDKLEDIARKMLSYNIPYAAKPTENVKKSLDLGNTFVISDQELMDKTTQLLDRLSKEFPNFSFGHEISVEEEIETIKNDVGCDLYFRDRSFRLGLIIKHKQSLNMMDGGAFFVDRKFDLDQAFEACSFTLSQYENKVDLPQAEMPVVFVGDQLSSYFLQHLNGKQFLSKSSAYADKLGQKLFSENFSLSVDRNSQQMFYSFFDGEGTVLPNDKAFLIEKGVVKSPYLSKQVANALQLPLTASAFLSYDLNPDLSPRGIEVECTANSVKQLLGGQAAVLVDLMSGGDFTAQGEYSSPVQVGYLFDGEKIIGRLPQISVSSTVDKLFGQKFVGKSCQSHLPNSRYSVHTMDVKKIGDWI